jgi:transposase InsO family protein
VKKSRFSEEKIIAALKQAEAGVKVSEIVRKLGVAEATFYNWKAKYGGMDASQLRRIDTNLPARRIVRALDELIELRGTPAALRMDNGPELISGELEKWARRHGVERRFIQPGRPMQNGFVERFNRTYRQEVLNCYVFETLAEVRQMTAEWITRYNEIRRHESLGNLSPRQYLMAKSP